jgi:hypothetical protein
VVEDKTGENDTNHERRRPNNCSLRCIRSSYFDVSHSITHRAYTHIGDFVVFAAAPLFGYKVGSFAGAIGAVAVDVFTGCPRWSMSIPAHQLEGLIPSLAKNKPFAL